MKSRIAKVATLTMTLFFVLVALAGARPYLHLDEARCALRGCYGSDNDVWAFGSRYGISFSSWSDYYRYNSYDICVRAWYSDGTVEAFEAYYPHSYDDSLDDIWDADRGWCPAWGATQ